MRFNSQKTFKIDEMRKIAQKINVMSFLDMQMNLNSSSSQSPPKYISREGDRRTLLKSKTMSMVPAHDLVGNVTQSEPKLIQPKTKRNIVTSKGKK